MPIVRANTRRGIGEMLRDLADGSARIVRDEIALARIELTTMVRSVGTGVVFTALAAVLTLLGALSSIAGIVLLIGDQWLPRDLYWVGALVVLAISGAAAFVFVRRGLRLVSPATLEPTETITTLREDKEWLKQRLTSGATSR